MDIPFNNLNGNLFGTKAMSVFFTTEEMPTGYVEPTAKQSRPALCQERINLIKRLLIYFKEINCLIKLRKLLNLKMLH
jgi:hypothetical protein